MDKLTIKQFCYDKYMDKECIRICNYLNSLPNIETSSSCCGHGKTSFMVCFKVLNNKGTSGLSFLGRCIDIRYGGNSSVQIRLGNTDTNYEHTCYVLTTTDLKGKEAYEAIEHLCNVMDEHLRNKNYLRAFNIVTYK